MSSILDTISKEDNVQEINKSLWMVKIVEQALLKRKEELIIDKINKLEVR